MNKKRKSRFAERIAGMFYLVRKFMGKADRAEDTKRIEKEYLKREETVEEAIKFAVKALGNCDEWKKKPVILHGIRVGLKLMSQNYDTDVVTAGILHDVPENSEYSAKDIKEKYSEKVARLVKANTADKAIDKREDRYVDTVRRCTEEGREALLVRAADLSDNCERVLRMRDSSVIQWMLFKLDVLCKASRPLISNEPIYRELESLYWKLKRLH